MRIRHRLESWLPWHRRRARETELERELRDHLDLEADEQREAGLSSEEADYAARRALGNTVKIKEDVRMTWGFQWLETLVQDMRYGLRQLRRDSGFTAVALLSLALGIGANLAIFQLIDAIRLRALPVQNPGQLAEIRIANGPWQSGNFTGPHPELTYPLWQKIRDHQEPFSEVFAFSAGDSFNLAQSGQVRPASGLWLSADALPVLGIHPLLGRFFAGRDDLASQDCESPVAVISYSFWQREYGGDPNAVGRTLTLNRHPFTVIGVTPASFFGVEVGRNFDVAVPLCAVSTLGSKYSRSTLDYTWWLDAIGRLKPGWSVERASAYLKTASAAWFQATLPTDFNQGDELKGYLALRLGAFPAPGGVSGLRGRYGNPLWLLIAISGTVLIIACANLANLLLARAGAREREIAVRHALGASRVRLIRQLLAESLLLAAFGTALGGALALAVSRFLVALMSTQDDPLFLQVGFDWRVFAFGAGLALVTSILFGLTPALQATRVTPAAAMKGGSRGLTAPPERRGFRRGLVISQVALSLVLLVGALLFVRSLRYLLTLDPGFQESGILIADVGFKPLNLAGSRCVAFKEELLDRLRALPGVDAAAEVQVVPLSGNTWSPNVLVPGRQVQPQRSLMNRVSPGFFRTMGTPLLAGRDFNDRDMAASPQVAIVNGQFAHRILGSTNPLGKTFQIEEAPGTPRPVYQVVGLVRDTKYYDLREDFDPIAFFPMAQDSEPYPEVNFLIRSDLPLAVLVSNVRRSIGDFSPSAELDFQVFETQVRESLIRERLLAILAGSFGFLATLLAVVGMYGLISYMVVRRTGEIGIRMALGGDRVCILQLVMGEAIMLLAAGVTIGTCLALAAAKTVSSMLFGLKPRDPLTFVFAIALFGAVALAATYFPARRASRLDPMVALRYE